jgi:hypothetical protein
MDIDNELPDEVTLYMVQSSIGDKFMDNLRPDVMSGRIRAIEHAHPQPPTKGPTMWTESAEAHQGAQQAFIKTTGN